MFRHVIWRRVGLVLVAVQLLCASTAGAQSASAVNYAIAHRFVGTAAGDAKEPAAGLVAGPDGRLYGTTKFGGVASASCPDGCGTVYRLEADDTVTVLHAFGEDGSDGIFPYTSLTLAADGQFYGMASSGGEFGWGAAFRMSPSGALTTIHSFNGIDGAAPTGRLLQLGDGLLYGTTAAGGANFLPTNTQCGTVFRMSPASGVVTTIHDFSLAPSQGCVPRAGLARGSDGKLYGATIEGGTIFVNGQTNMGVIYRLEKSGANFEIAYDLTPDSGRYMYGEMTQGRDGALYGAMTIGGQFNNGAIFRLTADKQYSVLHSFAVNTTGPFSDGESPVAALTLGADNWFYGTASGGGFYGCGTVFRIDAASNFTLIRSFRGCEINSTKDGWQPEGAVYVDAPTRTLWGTTAKGGRTDGGTIYRISEAP